MARVVGWNHCPRCGAGVDPEGSRVECGRCGLIAYAHSDPTASAVVLDGEGRVLLSRRAREPFAGKWDLPGGFLDEGEHPLDALRRELLEETGLEVEPLDFVGCWIDRYGGGDEASYTLNLYWSARVAGGAPEPADDVSELRWFPLDALPPDDEIAFENVSLALRSVGRRRS